MQDSRKIGMQPENALQSVEMLLAVVDGDTYEAVAARFGISHTAVERRIKSVAVQLIQSVGVDGLQEEGAAFVRRLRQHRTAILAALNNFQPRASAGSRRARAFSVQEVAQGAVRIKGRTSRTWHDLALYYLLFATGLRPLEIARLEVRDYLNADGSVRRISELRAEAAINGKPRPLYFSSSRLDEALAAYLRERGMGGQGLGDPDGLPRPRSAQPAVSFAGRRALQDRAQQRHAGAEPPRLPRLAGNLPQAVPLHRIQGTERTVGAPDADVADVRARGRRGSGGLDPGHQRAQRGAPTAAPTATDAGRDPRRTGVSRDGHPTVLHPWPGDWSR